MKHIAIISPCILPVPARKGGAVEGLVTRILDDNELNKDYFIDLFTIDEGEIGNLEYSYTKIIRVENKRNTRVADRITDKYYRTVPGSSSERLLDKEIVRCFWERISEPGISFDAVIIENMMSTACEIVHLCQGRYDFPIFFHMHNDVDLYRSPKQIRELVCFGVRFLAVSDYIRNQIIKCDKNAIVSTLHNGTDLSRFDRVSQTGNGNVSFLYAGRIIPGKGVKEMLLAFIEAFEKAEDLGKTNARLDIVGFSGFDRGYEGTIRKIAEGYSNITCKEAVAADEMPSLYSSADIVIMPTIDEEPFGLVALETMAMGTALIVSDSGALPEVVGEGAVIVDKSKDFVAGLSDAMKKLAYDESLRKEIAEKGYRRAHAVEDFDISNYYHNFTKLITEDAILPSDTISVIVPVYNVSAYLKRCVDSIISQTYGNLEIILVDDESTDESGVICDELATNDSRVKVIHQANAGLSAARNTGIDIATGSFIFFCDSDDYIQEDALEKMLRRLKRDHGDIVACGIEKVYDSSYEDNRNLEETTSDIHVRKKQTSDTSSAADIFTSINPGRWSGHESVIQMMRSNNVCSVAWNKLYKKELFEGIRFPLGVKNEDEALVYKLLYRAKLVSYIPDTFYKYYQRSDSIIHDDLQDWYHFFISASIDRIKFFEEMGDDELSQHSRITLLEWIKYSYRNIHDKKIRKELAEAYKENLSFSNAPMVMGLKKKWALLLWKAIRY